MFFRPTFFRLTSEWQFEEQAKNVLAQGPDTAVCESRNKLAIAQTKFRSTIHKLTYPLKTPSCGMFLASLSAPPLTRFVRNLAESALRETLYCCLCIYGLPINKSAIFLVRIEIILIFATAEHALGVCEVRYLLEQRPPSRL